MEPPRNRLHAIDYTQSTTRSTTRSNSTRSNSTRLCLHAGLVAAGRILVSGAKHVYCLAVHAYFGGAHSSLSRAPRNKYVSLILCKRKTSGAIDALKPRCIMIFMLFTAIPQRATLGRI